MPGQILHWQTDHVDGHPHLIFIKDKKHDKIIKIKKHLNQIASSSKTDADVPLV